MLQALQQKETRYIMDNILQNHCINTEKAMFVIYFLYICIAIILFVTVLHIFLSSSLKNYDSNVSKHTQIWQNIQKRCEHSKEYRLHKREIRLLQNPSMLAAFYEVYSTVSQDEFHLLIDSNKQQIIDVARSFKSTTMKAYFAYILHTLQLHNSDLSSDFNELMMEFALENSIYVRENSLKVLYSFGNAHSIVAIFHALSKAITYHCEILLTVGLMTF